MSLYIYPVQNVSITGVSTEAKQDDMITHLSEIEGAIEVLEVVDYATSAKQDTIIAKDFATSAKQDTLIAIDYSTSADQALALAELQKLEARLAGSLVPETHDYIAITYVAAGNGVGEIETVIYKTGGAGGSTAATLTLAYDASHRLSSVTAS